MINVVMLALYSRASQIRTTRERGQGTLEYIGMVAVAALLIGIVAVAFKGANLGTVVGNAIQTVLDIK